MVVAVACVIGYKGLMNPQHTQAKRRRPTTNYRSVGDFLRDAWWRVTHTAEASFDVAQQMAARGEYDEAIWRYRYVLRRQPNNARAWHNMGVAQLAKGDKAKAVEALKKSVALDAKNDSARFLLMSIDPALVPGFAPAAVPLDMVKSEFNSSALTYDAEMLARQGYQGHQHVYEALKNLLEPGEKVVTLLDAGCGTGLCGMLVAGLCRTLVGVDLSRNMLAQARLRREKDGRLLYHELIEAEWKAHLHALPTPRYEAIIAASVIPLTGDLTRSLQAALHGLKPGGVFLFTALKQEQQGYHLHSSLPPRFAHAKDYIEQSALTAGFEVQAIKEIPLYAQETGWLVTLFKPGA
jgi:predicted TPR repeat methyltransferase